VQDQLAGKLNTLDLSENPLGVQGARLLAKMMDPVQTKHQFLVSLSACKCGLSEAGGLAIIGALQANGRLQVGARPRSQLALSCGQVSDASGCARGAKLGVAAVKFAVEFAFEVASRGVLGASMLDHLPRTPWVGGR
jgi:hypothetical protein